VFQHFKAQHSRIYEHEPPSDKYFFEIWRSFCSYVKVRKVSRFAKCGRCEQLRNALQKAIVDGNDTTEIVRQRASHRAVVQREKREYKRKRELAILNPKQYCSIIIDGADQ